jgi:hypothetical protein
MDLQSICDAPNSLAMEDMTPLEVRIQLGWIYSVAVFFLPLDWVTSCRISLQNQHMSMTEFSSNVLIADNRKFEYNSCG